MKHMKKSIIVFGAVSVVLLMVSSVTAVECTNSKQVMKYIESEERTVSEDLTYLNSCMNGDITEEDILNLYLDKVPIANVLNDFFKCSGFIDFIKNNPLVIAFNEKLTEKLEPLNADLDQFISLWENEELTDDEFVNYSIDSIKTTFTDFSNEDEYIDLANSDEVTYLTRTLKNKLRNADLMEAPSENIRLPLKKEVEEDELKILSQVESTVFNSLIDNNIGTSSYGEFDLLVSIAVFILFSEKIIFGDMILPETLVYLLITAIIAIPALLLTGDVQVALMAFVGIMITPWYRIWELASNMGLFGIVVLAISILLSPFIVLFQLIVGILVFALLVITSFSIPKAWEIIRDVLDEAAEIAEEYYEKFFGDDDDAETISAGTVTFYGYVTYLTSAPAENVKIECWDGLPLGSPDYETYTDSDGFYEFCDLSVSGFFPVDFFLLPIKDGYRVFGDRHTRILPFGHYEVLFNFTLMKKLNNQFFPNNQQLSFLLDFSKYSYINVQE